jgi:hypothetical protein
MEATRNPLLFVFGAVFFLLSQQFLSCSFVDIINSPIRTTPPQHSQVSHEASRSERVCFESLIVDHHIAKKMLLFSSQPNEAAALVELTNPRWLAKRAKRQRKKVKTFELS